VTLKRIQRQVASKGRAMMKSALVLTALAVSAMAAHKQRDWQTGTVVETAHVRENLGGGGPVAIAHSSGASSNPYADAAGQAADTAMAAAAAARPTHRIWQGFTIQGAVYTFVVACPVWLRHTPNVTVHGPIKYTMEKGKFFLLDDDQKEFEMFVLEKALKPSSPVKLNP